MVAESRSQNFTLGLYRSGYTKKDEILYRAGNSEWKEKGWLGQYWSKDKPLTELSVRHEKAVPYHWRDQKTGKPGPRNTLDIGYKARWNAGAPKYSGLVAPQRDAKTNELFEGGTGQVFIPRNYGDESPLEKAGMIDAWDLK